MGPPLAAHAQLPLRPSNPHMQSSLPNSPPPRPAAGSGVNQWESDAPPKYVNNSHLSARVGQLNPDWNEDSSGGRLQRAGSGGEVAGRSRVRRKGGTSAARLAGCSAWRRPAFLTMRRCLAVRGVEVPSKQKACPLARLLSGDIPVLAAPAEEATMSRFLAAVELTGRDGTLA